MSSSGRSSSLELHVKDVFMWDGRAAVDAVKYTMSKVEEKETEGNWEGKESQFLTRNNLKLRELKIEQACQVLRASVAIHSYVRKDGRISAACPVQQQ